MTQVKAMYPLLGGAIIEVGQGDITSEAVDAIVNAANRHLEHGGGVARAIARAGGQQITRESEEWVRDHGPVTHDVPAVTGGGGMPCKFVIHAVGPVWGAGDEDAKLAAAINGSLRRAEELEVKTIAFPAISTGIYGFPVERAAGIFFTAIEKYFTEHPDSEIELVRLTLFDPLTVNVFTRAGDAHFHR
jgi:O-acetyl-ADP-ribose deacetylase (regulator of RNase III)